MMKGTFLTTVIAVLFALSATAGAITIVNPGFESPVMADGKYGYTADGWTHIGGTVAGVWNPEPAAYGGIAPEGLNVAWCEGPTGLAQVLAATLSSNTTYTLTVEVGNHYYYAWNGYKVQLLAGGNLLAEDDNTVAVASDTFALSTVPFDSTGSPFVGQALEIRLLAKVGTGEADFDNVMLTPEPATIGLLGMGALALIRRKRK